MDLKDSTCRYRVRGCFVLPKFGSTKNPFSAPVPTELIQAASEGTRGVARYQMTPAELTAARLKQTAKLPSPAAVPAREAFRKAVPTPWAGAKARQWLGGWAQRLNPLGRWLNRQPKSRPAVPKFNRPAVQGELSLANVKVMRNDLNDADVEIVAAKPAMKTKPGTVTQAKAPAALAEIQTGWGAGS